MGSGPRQCYQHVVVRTRRRRYVVGGCAALAMRGRELAVLTIKGKDVGGPVFVLWCGTHRDRQRVYWSHLGTYRAMHPELFDKPVLRDMEDLGDCAAEAVRQGYSAFKTNLIFPGESPITISSLNPDSNDQNAASDVVKHAEKQISTMRDAVGPDIDICLDINYNFKTEGSIAVGRILEPYNLFWLEIDNQDPKALAQIK